MFYNEVLKEFCDQKIKYLVVGGLAVNLHGVPRLTYDLDVVVSLDEKNLLKICEVMERLDFKPRLPVGVLDLADPEKLKMWINEKNMKAFSFIHKKDAFKVFDIVIDHPLDFKKAYKARYKCKTSSSIQIPVVSMEDLILMKKISGREKDESDIQMLKLSKKWTKNNA